MGTYPAEDIQACSGLIICAGGAGSTKRLLAHNFLQGSIHLGVLPTRRLLQFPLRLPGLIHAFSLLSQVLLNISPCTGAAVL